MPETFRLKSTFQAMRWDPENPQEFYDWMEELGYPYRNYVSTMDRLFIEIRTPRGIYRTLGPGSWFSWMEGDSTGLASTQQMTESYERVDPDSVTIPREEYERLQRAENILGALEAGGVR